MYDFVAETVADIENVDRPLTIGCHHGGGNGQAGFEDRLGDVIQQAGPVEAFHLDHGGDAGGFIVEMKLGLDAEGAGAGLGRLAGQKLAGSEFAAQGLFNGLGQAPQPFLVAKGFAFRVLH